MATHTAFFPLPMPQLRVGERLSRDEFERRYEAMPYVRAELLDGVVYIMSSPVSPDHSRPHGDLMTWVGYYKAFTPGVDSGVDGTVRLSDDSEPQPDVMLRILRLMGANRMSTRIAISPASPNLSAKWGGAPPATTAPSRCRSINAKESANSFSGASTTARSTGLS